MSDEEIDYSDIPPLTDEQLAAMRPFHSLEEWMTFGRDGVSNGSKVEVTLNLNPEVWEWFQSHGSTHAIETALRSYMETHP